MVRLLELEELPIRVTARGEWLHGDVPLHPRVQRLFAANVVPHADSTYSVKLGYFEHPLTVADTPYQVRRLDITEERGEVVRVVLSISDGREDELAAATLMQDADNVLYCRIVRHGLWVPCRFSPAQYHELVLASQRDDDLRLYIGGKPFDLAPYSREVLRR